MKCPSVLLFLSLVLIAVCSAARYPTYYDILNTTRSVSAKQVRLQYFKVSRHYHPDRNSEKSAQAKMTKINEAYKILSEPNERARYDLYLRLHGGMHHPQWDKNGSFSQWQTLMNMVSIGDYHWLSQLLITLLAISIGSCIAGAVFTLALPIFSFASASTFWIMLAVSAYNFAFGDQGKTK
uniref:J domain-containing protein n=1 Tax=Spongospora subterranea TaxID=70186 RepID=A0A0H5R6A6_9EUKA|eukprot:CRZ09371.1 hypothetical protein [Spongospora subterranea]